MREPVTVACAQVEPVLFDRDATIDRIDEIAEEAGGKDARLSLYERGVEISLPPTADDSEQGHDSIRHIARESRAFVLSCCVFQRASSYPDDVPLAEGPELLGRGGSAILGPDGSYLAGPLWDEEGILYAKLDPQRLYEERQRFDPAGHYHRPDVFRLVVS